MNTKEIGDVLTKTGKLLERNSPTILTFLGVSGLVTTIGLSIKATRKVDKKLNGRTEVDWNTAKFIAKSYIPTVLVAGMSIICIIGSNSINAKRNLALVGAYKLSEEMLKKYPAKIVEVLKGETPQDKEHKKSDTAIIIGNGKIDCYDQMSGRYFSATLQDLNKAVSRINGALFDGCSMSINDFYEEIGLDNISIGNDIGWNPREELVELNTWAMISEEGKPTLVVSFRPEPEPEPRRSY